MLEEHGIKFNLYQIKLEIIKLIIKQVMPFNFRSKWPFRFRSTLLLILWVCTYTKWSEILFLLTPICSRAFNCNKYLYKKLKTILNSKTHLEKKFSSIQSRMTAIHSSLQLNRVHDTSADFVILTKKILTVNYHQAVLYSTLSLMLNNVHELFRI